MSEIKVPITIGAAEIAHDIVYQLDAVEVREFLEAVILRYNYRYNQHLELIKR